MCRGQWKLVTTVKDGQIVHELFDLKSDLPEKVDLSSEASDLMHDMAREVEVWHEEVLNGVKMIAE